MIGFQGQTSLKSLNTRSSLAMLLRALYRMGLNYCVLPPSGDYAYVIVFTKEQLVSLIERSSSEMFISEISKRVAQGLFKPAAVFKPDSSSSALVSDGGFAEPEGLQVLAIGEDGAQVVSLKEALSPKSPEFPEWWEAPIPFAMCGYGELLLNHTAMLMFGPALQRMPVGDIPEKNEFLVMLEGGETHCSVTFRRLEGDIFILDDSTGDLNAAEEVAWWAAVGKAWAAALDAEQKTFRRCDAREAERLLSEKNSTNSPKIVLPCEWEGELLGYLCVEDKAKEEEKSARKPRAAAVPDKKGKKDGKVETKPRSVKPTQSKQRKEKPDAAENEVLKALGPQTMGLLTPGTQQISPAAAEEPPKPQAKEVKKETGGRRKAKQTEDKKRR